MSIAVVFDVSEKIDDFVKNQAPLKDILLDYYLNFVIYYGNLFSALLIFIAVIFFTSKMANRTEFIAILSSGVSFRRILHPYFAAATVLVMVSLFLNHYLIPKSNNVRVHFEIRYTDSGYNPDRFNIHREIEPGTIAYFQTYSPANKMGYRFSIEKWNPEGKLTYKLMSDRAVYDTVNNQWQIYNFYERTFLNGAESQDIHFAERRDTVLNLLPDDLRFKTDLASAMEFQELKDYIAAEKMRGSDMTAFYEIELYQRTSYPFAAYVLTLIAVSLASRKVRGGLGMNLVVGFVFAFIYIFSMRLTTVAATNAGLDPLIAVWIPNFMFAIIGVFIYRLAPK
jgi:lipopolysaccharide export system permease protein